jgi:hypothetical protein
MTDKYHAMALIAAGAGGLRDDQVAGLAHIFRQIARDENEACAKAAEECGASSNGMRGEVAKYIASYIRSRLRQAAAIEAPGAEDVI